MQILAALIVGLIGLMLVVPCGIVTGLAEFFSKETRSLPMSERREVALETGRVAAGEFLTEIGISLQDAFDGR